MLQTFQSNQFESIFVDFFLNAIVLACAPALITIYHFLPAFHVDFTGIYHII